MPLPLSPQVFAILNGLIEERAGLHYGIDDLELVRDKISTRAESVGFASLLDYYYFLRYDPGGSAELDALVEALVVHETYFFREADQLRVLVNKLLAGRLGQAPAHPGLGPAAQAVDAPVRIWCAACATDEEPLTLAMMLADLGVLHRVRVLATDVSERALARARSGEFAPRAARALPDGIEGRWLERAPGNRLRLKPGLLGAIEWRRVNLLDRGAISELGRFDAVLARNVLIYFADETVRRVVAQMAETLIPGGLLLVGASESLLRYGTSLSCEEHGGSFFYRRIA